MSEIEVLENDPFGIGDLYSQFETEANEGRTAVSGTGKRRGRPPKNSGDRGTSNPSTGGTTESAETPVLTLSVNKERKPRTTKKDKLAGELGNLISAATVLLALRPNREFWFKSSDELTPVSEPLAEILKDVSPKAVQELEKFMNPIALVMGAYAIFSEPVRMELYLLRNRNNPNNERISNPNDAKPSVTDSQRKAAEGYPIEGTASTNPSSYPNTEAVPPRSGDYQSLKSGTF
jgi:hypothetical protein